MIVVRDTETLKGKRLVATIGFFDGVHLGHRFLIHELKQVAEAAGLPSAVITFPEHPRAVLHADYQPKLLNSFEEKLKHLASTGIDIQADTGVDFPSGGGDYDRNLVHLCTWIYRGPERQTGLPRPCFSSECDLCSGYFLQLLFLLGAA